MAPGVDEFELAGLTKAASRFVKPPRVAESPAAFECKLWQTLPLPAPQRGEGYTLVIGSVVGVYIDDAFVQDGLVQSGAMRPLARLGYMDYSVLTPEVDVHDEPAGGQRRWARRQRRAEALGRGLPLTLIGDDLCSEIASPAKRAGNRRRPAARGARRRGRGELEPRPNG